MAAKLFGFFSILRQDWTIAESTRRLIFIACWNNASASRITFLWHLKRHFKSTKHHLLVQSTHRLNFRLNPFLSKAWIYSKNSLSRRLFSFIVAKYFSVFMGFCYALICTFDSLEIYWNIFSCFSSTDGSFDFAFCTFLSRDSAENYFRFTFRSAEMIHKNPLNLCFPTPDD